MFEIGRENKRINKLWEKMPLKKGETVLLNGALKQIVNSSGPVDYYRYNGSLTTPPCSEGVRWYVVKKTAFVSKGQLDYYQKVIGVSNNRPVQPLNARMVVD
jgi:carbonic anhydrase